MIVKKRIFILLLLLFWLFPHHAWASASIVSDEYEYISENGQSRVTWIPVMENFFTPESLALKSRIEDLNLSTENQSSIAQSIWNKEKIARPETTIVDFIHQYWVYVEKKDAKGQWQYINHFKLKLLDTDYIIISNDAQYIAVVSNFNILVDYNQNYVQIYNKSGQNTQQFSLLDFLPKKFALNYNLFSEPHSHWNHDLVRFSEDNHTLIMNIAKNIADDRVPVLLDVKTGKTTLPTGWDGLLLKWRVRMNYYMNTLYYGWFAEQSKKSKLSSDADLDLQYDYMKAAIQHKTQNGLFYCACRVVEGFYENKDDVNGIKWLYDSTDTIDMLFEYHLFGYFMNIDFYRKNNKQLIFGVKAENKNDLVSFVDVLIPLIENSWKMRALI